MKRLSWHIKSFAWWCALTGALVAWCVFVTAELVASSERTATVLVAACLLSFVGLLIWGML